MKPLLLLTMILPILGCQCSIRNTTSSPESTDASEGKLVKYHYRTSTMRLVPAEYYLLECTEEGELHFTWSRGGDEAKTIKVSEEVREKVDAMRREYNLNKLKESYTPPFNVLDGVMWHVEFRYENRDKSIYSSGENAWPAERLREGIKAINTYLLSLGEAATEADIIGRIPYRDL